MSVVEIRNVECKSLYMIIFLSMFRNAEQGDQHHGDRGRGGRRRGAGQPQRVGRADGADQGHVRQEAGDDEEDVHHHRPQPRGTESLINVLHIDIANIG